ncbi:helix-turn-helix domain-containing protein [Streptomyces niveiscabiei]|uniref:helix-turn-helix domain-containing protein n=1 Tax=Streptomyces niveiscabiei TaxID=164115 RepID=UPI0029AA7D98|nr:helix-turn-helix domain-containing protein [Streptomyces niveiscabiei]MDX3382423.1 helix-turn-helix domain-containing protein [Streptomyces niveiscabiei]
MSVRHGPEPVAGILRGMADDTDVCRELVTAARRRSPELARLTEEETRSHAMAMLRAAGAWFTALEHPDPHTAPDNSGSPTPSGSSGSAASPDSANSPSSSAPFSSPGPLGSSDLSDSPDSPDSLDEQDFTAALLLGADRAAQGVPMTVVLRGVQAALTRAAEITVDRCRSAGIPDRAQLDVVLRLKEYGDAVERQVINGYRAAERETPRGTGAARTRLLRQVLLGGALPPLSELTRAGIRPGPDGLHHCLAADNTTLPGIPAATALLDGRLAALSPLPPTPDQLEPGALVVMAPAAPLAHLPELYRLCVDAVDLLRRQSRHGLHELTDLAAELALSQQPLLGAYVTTRRLGALDPTDDFHRQLALTALTFLDLGRRLDQTAAALFTHPNTVRYRLARLQQITDSSLAGAPVSHTETLHWWWALTTWLGEERTVDASYEDAG